MKKIFYIIAAALLALGLNSCNMTIENPKAGNFVGTWDLQSTEIIGVNGSVTTSVPKTLDYLVITKDKISFYESSKLSKEGKFDVKDNVIYVDGVATYKVEKFSLREMTLSQDGLGLLVNSYRANYKKR